METRKHAIVINAMGNYVEFICVDINENPMFYALKNGESLIFTAISVALTMNKPRWDGEKWVETQKIEITPETIDNARSAKLNEVNKACQAAIQAGVDINTSKGIKHFSLTLEDQVNIDCLARRIDKAMMEQSQLINFSKGVPYHADGEFCDFWSLEDFAKIEAAATAHKLYHQTYCNYLRQYIQSLSSLDEINTVKYGIILPAEYADKLALLLGIIQ